MLTVLVADDEFAVLEALSSALEAEGHRVLPAGDGGDALRLLAGHTCDVVVCDEAMPVLTGPQLVSAMRADPRLAPIPVILMVDVLHSSSSGADAAALDLPIVAKPVMLSQLLALVEHVAASRAAAPPR